MEPVRYDNIGHGYATTRREDPRLRDHIVRALGESRTVVNVGAGTGSYEPDDRVVIPIEPSTVMTRQRPADGPRAVRGTAAALPLRDHGADAAMAVLTIHHWDERVGSGVQELRRVARGPVVIVTYDIDICTDMWLYRDYFPEAAALDSATFPTIDQVAGWLGGTVDVETVLTHRDSPDWNLAAFWAHPERLLDESARRGTSAFARGDPTVVARVVAHVERDLGDGTWDQRNGHLRELEVYDAGMRIVVARP